MEKTETQTRQQILKAAARQFAHAGYSGASVQDIVDAARVSKPTLYYYFGDKAGLYQSLVAAALDERYRLMQEAAARADAIDRQLVEILAALFDHLRENRESMRIAFATAFAAPGEVPENLRYMDQCQRNFEFVHSLIKRAQTAGRLNRRFASKELANGFYGQMNFYVMSHLLLPDMKLNRQTAERIVDLFLSGAGAQK